MNSGTGVALTVDGARFLLGATDADACGSGVVLGAAGADCWLAF
jgi:hypothetical protein